MNEQYKKQNQIARQIVKMTIPLPKKGNVIPRLFIDHENEKNNENQKDLLWYQQLDNFIKEFKKHYDNDKTYRDVIVYDYEIRGSCNTTDEFLIDILRDRMYYIGYKVALIKKVDNLGRILYQSY